MSAASPLLPRLKLSSYIANLCGNKGTGKTIALEGAASFFGNGVDPAQGAQTEDPPYISRFNGTINGYEKHLGKYSPLPVLLDELTEANATLIYEICYMMASGQGKIRMDKNGDEAPRESWQSNIIASAEGTIADKIAASGKQMHGGQADRAIDIPISNVGVLNCFGPFDSFNAVARHLKRACAEQYGTPGEAMIQYCCDNPDVLNELLAMVPDIEKELLPADCGEGERRVVQRLAGAVVAGRLAVMAEVFDDDAVEKIDAAIKLVTKLWWDARAGSLGRIRRFFDEHKDKLHYGKPVRGSKAIAFVEKEGTFIPVDVFNDEFGEDAKRMLDELAGLNALKTEQTGRRVVRACDGYFRGYIILTERIWPVNGRRAA
jgi:hypothetical protein